MSNSDEGKSRRQRLYTDGTPSEFERSQPDSSGHKLENRQPDASEETPSVFFIVDTYTRQILQIYGNAELHQLQELESPGSIFDFSEQPAPLRLRYRVPRHYRKRLTYSALEAFQFLSRINRKRREGTSSS